jgi:hypothetical protein
LDGKPIKKTDFFFGVAMIENLVPRKYEIEIKKDGFHAWKKTLEIKEKEVTDAKNIVLIPQSPEFSILDKGVENSFFSPDGKKVVLKETSKDGWTLKLLELEKNVKSHLINQQDLSKGEISLSGLTFSPDSKRILLRLDSKGNSKYVLIDLEKTPPSLTSLDFLGVDELRSSSPFANARVKDVKDLFFHPDNPQKLILLKNGEISEVDLSQKKISLAILENVKSFQISNKDVYYFLGSGPDAGFLFRTDISFSGREKINENPFPLKKEGEYKICIFSDKIFLQDEQNLYLFNLASNDFENFFETGREPKISPDFKKIVCYSDYEIWILFMKDEFSQPQKTAGERQFIARFSEKIGNVFWLTSHYLIFNSGSKIKIAEIDDRDKINTIDFIDFKEPEMFWSEALKKLYVLTENNLYGSQMLLP